jgi:hypothetical protein
MSYTKITARIVDQTLQLSNVPLLASGGVEEIQITCKFCPLWDGYGKAAVFFRKNGPVFTLPLVDDAVVVPWEVLTEAGDFYFGIMGTAANTRTTEVVAIHLEQGTITTSHIAPSEPTPDLYGQLLATLAIYQTRLQQLAKMRSTGGATEHVLTDEYITAGKIKTNGASAHIRFTITGLSLIAGGYHWTDYCIPPELAPLGPVEIKTSDPDINVTMEAADAEHEGWARMLIENPSNSYYDTYMTTICEAYYPLASVSISELADARVGYDGQEYPTAGDAIRDQISALIGYPAGGGSVSDPEYAALRATVNALAQEVAAFDSEKQDTLGWVMAASIEAMLAGNYAGVENSQEAAGAVALNYLVQKIKENFLAADKIQSGTELPETAPDGTIFFLIQE